MRLIITEQIGLWAATYVKNKINFNNRLVLGLPTGSTPLDMYKNLISMYNNKEVSFKDVVTFNMDEYIGLDPNHPQSYNKFMMDNFFNHIDINKNNINIPNGIVKDFKKEAFDYEEKIKKYNQIDLFIGGVGEDGHIAFNEPFSSLMSKTRDKDLTKNTILANSRFFNNDLSKVPTKALTVGVSTIMSAKEVMILVSGIKKAEALHHLIEGSISHVWPVTALQMHPTVIVIADEAACMELKLKTVKYFKEMEDEYSNIL